MASRGKLRGLTLPIAKGKKSDSINKGNVKRLGGVSKAQTSRESLKVDSSNHLLLARVTSTPNSTQPSIPTTFGFVNVDPTMTVQSPGSEEQWAGQVQHNAKRSVRRHSLEPISLPPVVPLPDFSNLPMTASAIGGYIDRQYEQAMDYSPARSIFNPSLESTPVVKQQEQNWSNGYFPDSFPQSWPSETMSSSLSSDISSRDFVEDDGLHELVPNDTTLLEVVDGSQIDQTVKEDDLNDFDGTIEEIFPCDGQYGDQRQPSLSFTNSMPSLLVGGTRALRELINYYDQVISPVIVAFDGPTNPYRMHVLRLASESDSLQHAIAALSASNLRMRRDYETVTSTVTSTMTSTITSTNQQMFLTDIPHETTHDASVRKSSMAHKTLRDSLDEFGSQPGPGQPSQRELYHKGESIRALNAKLGDPSVKDDDSVLATLLVLCLYHMCDTGVAKFRTQFAGVKKILALRNTKKVSRESRWLVTMFRWFDAMTATVNDREGQFEDEVVDCDSFDLDEWSLENLAGCDSRLFKIISNLGRLNLLSQGKAVNGSSSRPPRSIAPRRTYDFYSMHTRPTETTWSGTNWSGTNQTSDVLADQPDPQTQFAVEWQATRQELLDWQFDTSTVPLYSNVNTLDLNHISESFRYSALLYTERLAYPSTPSSAPRFQSLVGRAILHIQAVKSDVYLLWPLFITGTECVLPEHRDLVRKRCLAIQEDSGFFNNMSTLSLLDKVWEDADQDVGRDGLVSGLGAMCGVEAAHRDEQAGPFKWRKAMGKVDGEYIVI